MKQKISDYAVLLTEEADYNKLIVARFGPNRQVYSDKIFREMKDSQVLYPITAEATPEGALEAVKDVFEVLNWPIYEGVFEDFEKIICQAMVEDKEESLLYINADEKAGRRETYRRMIAGEDIKYLD